MGTRVTDVLVSRHDRSESGRPWVSLEAESVKGIEKSGNTVISQLNKSERTCSRNVHCVTVRGTK